MLQNRFVTYSSYVPCIGALGYAQCDMLFWLPYRARASRRTDRGAFYAASLKGLLLLLAQNNLGPCTAASDTTDDGELGTVAQLAVDITAI
jgi:hypothetical protein